MENGRSEGMNAGFDPGLTLVDTRRATEVAAARINDLSGTRIDRRVLVSRIGLPIRPQLSQWVPERHLDDAIEEFRTTFPGSGAVHLVPAAAAHDALAHAKAAGSRHHVPAAARGRAHAQCLPTAARRDHRRTDRPGEGPAAMRETGLACYVGDHPLDMAGARAADVRGIGVLTGFHSAAELREACAAAVLHDLTEFNQNM
jgi:phosphoglycolate phosphatase